MNKKDLFRPYTGEEPYIFISYSHDDSEIVYDIISDINSRGYRIWHDDGIPTGDNFVDTLAVKIKKCDIFLCFISRNYIASDYCKTELNYAFKQKKKVIPIMLDDVELPEGIDFRFAAINWSSLASFDSHYELVDRLCDLDKDVLATCFAGKKDAPIHGFRLGEQKDPDEKKKDTQKKEKQEKKKKISPLILAAAAILLIGAVVFALSRPGKPVSGTEQTPYPVTDYGPASAAPERTAAPVAVQPLPTLKPEALALARSNATDYLTQRLAAMCPMATYETDDPFLSTASCTYENAVAALALLSEGDLENATKILDALVEGMKSDPDYHDRFRNAYFAGNAAALPGYWDAQLNQWIQDAYYIGTSTRSSCAAAVALLRANAERENTEYLKAASAAVDWVIENCSDAEPGFISGYTGWKDAYTKMPEKATVDNLWMLAACRMLEGAINSVKYPEAAASAQAFILKAMYSAGDSRFFQGTKEDGVTPETNLILTEVQALASLFTGESAGLDNLSACLTAEAGYSYSNADTSGMWLEGTGIAALALKRSGEEEAAGHALAAMAKTQLPSGGFPQTSIPSLETGEKDRAIHSEPSVSPCAWFILAVNGADFFA